MKKYLLLFLFFITRFSICITASRGIQPFEFERVGGILVQTSYTNPLILSQSRPIALGIDVNYEAVVSTTLIKITANNVTLDLQGHTLSQKNAFTSNKTVTGIYIENGLSNVTIKN